MSPVKINENIRFLRKQLGLTQDQFAQQLDIKRSLVGAYEEGRAEPGWSYFKRWHRWEVILSTCS